MANGGGGGRRRKGSRRAKVKKKTKYLSLSRHLAQAVEVVDRSESLSVEDSSPPLALVASPPTEEAVQTLEEDDGDGGGDEQQQHLDPFALHPEAPSMLFAAAPSLNDILGASYSSSFSGGGGGESSSCAPSPDASGGTGRFEGEEEDLARRALRGRERWVYCRSSSSSPSAATAATTTSSSCSSAASTGARPPLLKLDYDEILAAWAGRGSLYISAAADLAEPKLEPDSVLVEVEPWRRQAAAWIAPDTAGRAESVRRYKEKRQARLFSKRIRYEVRRINAVRRPRLKGRFIRENEGVAMAT